MTQTRVNAVWILQNNYYLDTYLVIVFISYEIIYAVNTYLLHKYVFVITYLQNYKTSYFYLHIGVKRLSIFFFDYYNCEDSFY